MDECGTGTCWQVPWRSNAAGRENLNWKWGWNEKGNGGEKHVHVLSKMLGCEILEVTKFRLMIKS